MISIDQAIEVFACGFSFTRSFTHPYRAERIENHIRVVRDAPRRRGDYRSEEYIACGVSPRTLDAVARRYHRARYRICAILPEGESDERMRAEYKALGYRLMTTEAFMAHDLKRIPIPANRHALYVRARTQVITDLGSPRFPRAWPFVKNRNGAQGKARPKLLRPHGQAHIGSLSKQDSAREKANRRGIRHRRTYVE